MAFLADGVCPGGVFGVESRRRGDLGHWGSLNWETTRHAAFERDSGFTGSNFSLRDPSPHLAGSVFDRTGGVLLSTTVSS